MCIQEYFWLVLCWEVCPLSECALSEVSLYSRTVGTLSLFSSFGFVLSIVLVTKEEFFRCGAVLHLHEDSDP